MNNNLQTALQRIGATELHEFHNEKFEKKLAAIVSFLRLEFIFGGVHAEYQPICNATVLFSAKINSEVKFFKIYQEYLKGHPVWYIQNGKKESYFVPPQTMRETNLSLGNEFTLTVQPIYGWGNNGASPTKKIFSGDEITKIIVVPDHVEEHDWTAANEDLIIFFSKAEMCL